MRKNSNKKKCLTYKEKTNFPVGTGSDIFYREFFQMDDIEKIVNLIFKNDQLIDTKNFREMLNNVISFAVMVRHTALKPGKADKKELVSKICEIAENLENHLNILTNQYGYDTFKHIPILVKDECQWKEIDTYDFLSNLKMNLLNLAHIRDVAIKRIDAGGGKKTGNNSKDAIPNLIYHLVNVYEKLTGKNARENFQQHAAGELPYKGQFYDFVSCVFGIINENYYVRYPNTKIINPFKADSKNKNSHSLGKYILKVFRLSPNSR